LNPQFLVPAAVEAVTEPADEAPVLLERLPRLQLREPLPAVIESPEALATYCDRLAAGSGPVALDAERASGYRYSQRAYLVQVRREGAGTALIDPTAFADLTGLDNAIGDAEWILHAATQDLACLAELGLRPRALFDTELAGRLLNLPRVGLATLVEHFLGRSLAKEHSAADWSTRPLPEPWLVYAALDVEVLVELRDLIDAELQVSGKREWARQDFAALLSFSGPPERIDPWRRTSGLHRARGRRTLGLVRELWLARDTIARERDTTPGRILPDATILEIAAAAPTTREKLLELRGMRGRGPRRFVDQWLAAVRIACALPERELPEVAPRIAGPPPPKSWADKRPEAAKRFDASRSVVTALAEELMLPPENLIAPAVVRALAWEPPTTVTPESIADAMREAGARPWQLDHLAAKLAAALS
jgi:ribonuclease D